MIPKLLKKNKSGWCFFLNDGRNSGFRVEKMKNSVKFLFIPAENSCETASWGDPRGLVS